MGHDVLRIQGGIHQHLSRNTGQHAIGMAEQLGLHIVLDSAYAWLAEMRLENDDRTGAQEAARQGMDIAQRQTARLGLALNLMILGRLAIAEGKPDEGKHHLHEALQHVTALQVCPEIARCHALLTIVAREKRAKWRHHDIAERLFRKMGMLWDLQRLARPS